MNGIFWYGKGFPSKGLQQLLHAHSLTPSAAHRALADAENTLRLLSVLQPDGTTYLAELLVEQHTCRRRGAKRSSHSPLNS